ncbi:U2 small nuclear ribonucleoprotein auxiliary factor 35 kDa subunit-related protein 1 [Patella vulgata]|uniref:U2 small nuclear ribonucleoprotein auxiliary factor 35 kDa subunit-related protein 1 n=1 Tax=Patella vulgata TaxID=6465 RepID=UPI00217FA92C|nr:U2 small nuclear ribonucleoprotein auxiliary factor 35 kDa subunit-related protein 1 [Patella vulgata]
MSVNCKKEMNLSHKQWKKLKRKQKRVAEALLRAGQENDDKSESSSDSEKREREEKEREKQHQLFLERERLAQIVFLANKEKERKEKEYLEEQQKKIKEEWEELKKKEAEEREKRETEKDRQDALLKEATVHENKDAWHNPIAPVIYSSERPVNECPFFKKTGACKYGDSCSRSHDYPEESKTVLIPGMFSHFRLDQTLIDEYDTDLSLEYEDKELYNSFLEFYEDVLPEFKSIGTVTQFKVCSNCTPHLRGNVYITFKSIEEAQQAVMKFNGRWYAGKQLNCEYRNIALWKSAICGLFSQKSCPKGNICNFLHVFHNPRNEFRDADFDNYNGEQSYRRDRRPDYRNRNPPSRRYRSRSRSRSRSRLKHRSRSERSRSRSHSRQRYSRHRSKSRSRYSNRKRSRSRSRYSQGRSRSNSQSRQYYRDRSYSSSDSESRRSVRNKKSKKSKKRKRSKSRSNSRLNFRSISHHKHTKELDDSPTKLDNIIKNSGNGEHQSPGLNESIKDCRGSNKNGCESNNREIVDNAFVEAALDKDNINKKHRKHKKNKHKTKKNRSEKSQSSDPDEL